MVLLVIIVIADVATVFVPGAISYYFSNHIPLIVAGGLFLLFLLKGIYQFRYNDDYEIMSIETSGLILGKISSKFRNKFEFPKRKLYDYSVEKIMFEKYLTLKISSRSGSFKTQRFNISFLSATKRKRLLQSLALVKSENRA